MLTLLLDPSTALTTDTTTSTQTQSSISTAGSPIDASDSAGQTALHHAIAEGNGDAAVFLLQKGAQGDKRDGEGRLAIEGAPDGKVGSFVRGWAEREGWDLGLGTG